MELEDKYSLACFNLFTLKFTCDKHIQPFVYAQYIPSDDVTQPYENIAIQIKRILGKLTLY